MVFHPLFDIGPRKFAPGGTTDKDGWFQLSSVTASDGAPEGEYAVTFTWPEPSKDPEEGNLKVDRWQNKYGNPAASRWKIQIREGTSELPPFQLD